MKLNAQISRHNYRSFIWHIIFFSVAINFMDFDTVIPAMLVQSGASAFQIGLMTAILLGGAKFAQLIAAPFLFYKKNKKPYLILGISIRFIALFSIATSFYYIDSLPEGMIIYLIFFFISFFSLSEAFASLSYTDILGKSVLQEKRKSFLSLRQAISSSLIFLSAFAVKEILKMFAFPDNYSVLFLLAGISLAIASLGFWNLKEVKVQKQESNQGLIHFLRLLRDELKGNKNLWSYLIIINTLGIGMGVLPFMILFAKENIGLDANQIGNFVILKTIGLVVSGLVLFRYANRFGYKSILYAAVIVSASIPVFGLFFGGNALIFQFAFLLGGIYVSFFTISRSGVLLEISTDTNRIIYAVLAGIGNILITIFPLLAGLVIEYWGFNVVFIMISATILISLFFIHRLKCK